MSNNPGNTSVLDINDFSELIDDEALMLLSCGQHAIDVLQSSYGIFGFINEDMLCIKASWEAAKSAYDDGLKCNPLAAQKAITVFGELEKVLDKRITEVTAAYASVDEQLKALGASCNDHDMARVSMQITELKVARTTIVDLASGTEDLRFRFSLSPAGKQVQELWQAILNCDTDRLARMLRYASRDMFDCYPVRHLLDHLLAEAGLEISTKATEIPWGNNKWAQVESSLTIFQTTQHGQYKGLQVTYTCTFYGLQSTDAEVVHGVIRRPEPGMRSFAFSGYVAESAKVWATHLAETLRAHYSSKNS